MKLDGGVDVDHVWVDIVDAAEFSPQAPMAVGGGGGGSSRNDYSSAGFMRNADIRPESSCGALASTLSKKASAGR
jgi:hypothetical protein